MHLQKTYLNKGRYNDIPCQENYVKGENLVLNTVSEKCLKFVGSVLHFYSGTSGLTSFYRFSS